MNSDELFEKIKIGARAIAEQKKHGALHIFVADGNCLDDDIEFCLNYDGITPEERTFAQWMLCEFSEDERVAAFAFSHCDDLQRP